MSHQNRQFAFRSPPNKKVGSRPLRIATGLGFSSIVTRTFKSKLQKGGSGLVSFMNETKSCPTKKRSAATKANPTMTTWFCRGRTAPYFSGRCGHVSIQTDPLPRGASDAAHAHESIEAASGVTSQRLALGQFFVLLEKGFRLGPHRSHELSRPMRIKSKSTAFKKRSLVHPSVLQNHSKTRQLANIIRNYYSGKTIGCAGLRKYLKYFFHIAANAIGAVPRSSRSASFRCPCLQEKRAYFKASSPKAA